ncbi:hypothetical protein RJ640_029433 [Escallonia rubra]|uniref:PGG domain-containing protein n=1 Tax=Escallonia rubra TaxID=112253 RepID=A0AA88UMQ2_9ASTE|nr:hypothetical protein RJ640_029433 [Escallonia rubra]
MAGRPDSSELGRIKDDLFQSAMKGDWKAVVETYDAHPEVHKAKITKSGDTALHIAVLDGQESTVQELVELICQKDVSKEALGIANERRNTPLHLAASLGNVSMCKCIAHESLIGNRNVEGETPLFLAALHGKKDAFLCLSSICGDEGRRPYYWRRNDGDTILHVAISGDYFDLTNEIIRDYPDVVNFNNEQGLSPLHLLASKPSAFRSGSHLGRLNSIIYHSKGSREKNEQSDAENPAQGYAQGHGLFPPNYRTCFGIIQFVSKAMLIILGLGSRNIIKLREKKHKHIWSVEIMNKLLESAKTYRYENNGGRPKRSQSWPKDGETMPYQELDDPDGGYSENNDDSLMETMIVLPPDIVSEDENGEKESAPEVKGTQSILELEPSSTEKNGDREIVNKILELFHKLATDKKGQPGIGMHETPILIAAKNGITEIVQKILEDFPVAIHDMNLDKKNIVLLAVENRQPHVYKLLLNRTVMKDTVFRKVDKDGNSALHLAATLGKNRPWRIPGAALQMQWEDKWYKFVKESMPLHFFARYNKTGQTPHDIFTDTHKDLLKDGGEWLTHTAESCSVVAALIATVAFATSATVPGGVKQESGIPTLENQPAFNIFAISSLVALCFSVTSLVMFLAILTSRYEAKDFSKDLPNKLLTGLTSLFVSIAAMLVSFCAGHFFILKDKLKYAAFPVYAITCLPVTFFAIAQFPLYFDLMWATIKKVPQRSLRKFVITPSSKVKGAMAWRADSSPLGRIKDELFQSAMKGDWKEVVKIYKAHPEVHKEKITKSGDTVLHIAVLDGQESKVHKLVELIREKGVTREALGVANVRGNTPLHLAASVGSVSMCECIADGNASLIGDRNGDGETPLFLAVLHGNKDAFLCLSRICGDEGNYYWRRKDGDTILHVAISGDYFELAYEIINHYKDVVNSKNEEGLSPLHLLASKPSAFRSGSHLGRLNKIIYHSKGSWGITEPSDAENPAQGYAQGHELFPPNYQTCFGIIKFVSKATLIILGLGSGNIIKLTEKKQKHIWSVEIMNKLLESAKTYRYDDNGGRPKRSQSLFKDDETVPYQERDDRDRGSGSGDNDDVLMETMIVLPPDIISENEDEDGEKERTPELKRTESILEPSTTEKNGDGEIVNKILELFHKLATDKKGRPGMEKQETPILIAAKNGITEIVQKILEDFPVAIHDMNLDKKNMVLLAVEHRQPHVYQLLLNRTAMKDTVFRRVDKDGNSALHLAAMLGEYRPWRIPGAALQMQWELKWYEFVKESMPLHFFARCNKTGMTPKDIFIDTHKDLLKDDGEWLTNTAKSCSVVSALIASVAFATSTTVPGGLKENSGIPTLENQPAFNVFAISSLLALCFSVTSMVMFLAILTSRYQEKDFSKNLPKKLLTGLTSLFVSIAAMLVSFCAGHFLILKDKLKYAAFPIRCYNLYEYPRVYEDCCLRCQNCQRAFHASVISALPSLVSGKDAHCYCWGFFPMGFRAENSEAAKNASTRKRQSVICRYPDGRHVLYCKVELYENSHVDQNLICFKVAELIEGDLTLKTSFKKEYHYA